MSYKEKLQHINTFIFDVDGVLTDGSVILDPSGEMVRTMNTRDGYALQHAIKKGYNICIITGGNSIMVKKINVLESGLYELVSINPEFEPYKISALQIQEVWEVSSRISFGIEEPQDSKLLHQLKESMNLLKQQLEEATLN